MCRGVKKAHLIGLFGEADMFALSNPFGGYTCIPLYRRFINGYFKSERQYAGNLFLWKEDSGNSWPFYAQRPHWKGDWEACFSVDDSDGLLNHSHAIQLDVGGERYHSTGNRDNGYSLLTGSCKSARTIVAPHTSLPSRSRNIGISESFDWRGAPP